MPREITYDGPDRTEWVEDGGAVQGIDWKPGSVVHTRQTLETRADQALANLRTYVELTGPTQAQTVAAVKLLCRVAIGLIRLQIQKLDDTE